MNSQLKLKDQIEHPEVMDIIENYEVAKVESVNYKAAPPFSVTSREIEVLELLSEGLTVKEIAKELYLSAHTIVSHKKNLLEKFKARNSIELAVKAVRYQII